MCSKEYDPVVCGDQGKFEFIFSNACNAIREAGFESEDCIKQKELVCSTEYKPVVCRQGQDQVFDQFFSNQCVAIVEGGFDGKNCVEECDDQKVSDYKPVMCGENKVE